MLPRLSGAVLLVLMVVGALFLWVGVPAGWLWIGSQLQNSSGVGTATAVTMVGSIATILLLVPMLGWLNRRHVELKEARGEAIGRVTALEAIMVTTATVAVIGFSAWFFLFAGASPVPINVRF